MEVPMETVTFISHATQSRLRTVVEKVSTIAQHRLDSCKVGRLQINMFCPLHTHTHTLKKDMLRGLTRAVTLSSVQFQHEKKCNNHAAAFLKP